jgi:acyl-CoA thioesterase
MRSTKAMSIVTRLRPSDPDAFLDAGRYALVLDSFTWPAAAHAHVGDPRFIAPTLSFSVEFQQRTRSEWLLSDAYAPCATAGHIVVHNRVWSSDGLLLATGNGTLICRPRPQPRS